MGICRDCFDGKIYDEHHQQYENLDREIIRLTEVSHFSYEEAFKRAIRLYPAVKNCPECNGTGKIGD
ncbi:hypothetical protein CYL18_07745 [Pradoshia eiseniae]|uniref:Uncharacterized protein n=1 Tax=Pradoshia eiseniae TaxID=2064768 RepID=A0A2S7N185_9BACI|nr:hypothetical protein [Pradoshia eiseniae]PQD95773.1 hypothetical protein CYL18_07745 [Pradoshia eiseniae]